MLSNAHYHVVIFSQPTYTRMMEIASWLELLEFKRIYYRVFRFSDRIIVLAFVTFEQKINIIDKLGISNGRKP